jgi:hypothetical protein
MNLNLKKKIAIIILPLIFFGIATTVIFNKNVVESKLPLKICLGEFAFCGASSTKPTGNKMMDVSPTVNREFVITNEPGGGMSNMWSFPCNVMPKEVNGTKLSKCYGPINETVFPFRGARTVEPGETSVTQAPEGSSYPVGAIIPVTDAELLTENQDEI